MLNPEVNALVVAFLGRELGTLGGQPTGAKEPTDMVWMVGDMESIPQELNNPTAGPQGGFKSEGLRPFKDPLNQATALPQRQFGWASRGGLGQKALGSSLAVRSLPAPHRAAVYPKSAGYLVNLKSMLQELYGSKAATFQFGRTPLWSHTVSPPQESIGHYLYRNQ